MNLTLPLLILAVTFSQSPKNEDPYLGVFPDTGKSLHEFGRPAFWEATKAPIHGTTFTASAGPYRYQDEENEDWDYYSISIERPHSDGSYVFFSRDYEIEKIENDLILENVRELFTYDELTRTVRFRIGQIEESYTLPKEPK